MLSGKAQVTDEPFVNVNAIRSFDQKNSTSLRMQYPRAWEGIDLSEKKKIVKVVK